MQSPWAKTSKVLAAIVGGLLGSLGVHMSLALAIGYTYVVPTSVFTVFIVWVCFMLVVYWVEKPWKAWGILGLIIATSAIIIYLLKF